MYYILVLTEKQKKNWKKYSGFAYGFTIILKFGVIMLFLIFLYNVQKDLVDL
jgi:hypothetical protein